MKCNVCSKPVMLIEHYFPTRQDPKHRIIAAALYFSDPYFGGDGSNYCSPECSCKDYMEKKK